jgi:allophanate hydrolase subunit 2
MGCRLDGEIIEHKDGGDIISDGIAFGAIQVPSAGKPIIMLSDRQTTGGYTKIANVITADFRILGQLKAGDKVRFEKVSIRAAQDALLTQRAALKVLRTAVSR